MKPEDFDAIERAYRLKLITFPKAVEAYKIWAAVTVSPDPEFINRIESRLERQNHTKEQTKHFIDITHTNCARLLGLPETTSLDVFEILSSTANASLLPSVETIQKKDCVLAETLAQLDKKTADTFLNQVQMIAAVFSESVAH